jgi:hypothetical protein
MKAVFLIFTTFLLFFLVSTCPGQPTVNATEVRLERTGEPVIPFGSITGTFRFLAGGTDVNGTILTNSSNGLFIGCRAYLNPCLAGGTIRILDDFTGNNSFRQGTDPVIVNGTTYPTVVYRGTLTLNGGTVRLPYNQAKRRTVKLTRRASLTGTIGAYTNPTFSTVLFFVNVNLTGTVTIELLRRLEGFGPGYDVNSVVYNFPPAQ